MNPKNFLSVPLMLMLLSGMPWSDAFAAKDVNTPVEAHSGDRKVVGNVKVNGEGNGVVVEADNKEAADKSGSVTVDGSVTLTNNGGSDAYGVGADADCGDATINVFNDVTVNSKGNAVGVVAMGKGDNKATVTVGRDVFATSTSENGHDAAGVMLESADVNISGKVSAKSLSDTRGVVMYEGGKVTVGKGVTAEGKYPEGVVAYALEKSVVNIKKGGILSKGVNPLGMMIMSGNQEKADVSVKVGEGGVTADSTGEEVYNGAVALGVSNLGGQVTADITGDVVAKSKKGNAAGIGLGTFIEVGFRYDGSLSSTDSDNFSEGLWDSGSSAEYNPGNGKSKILIHGNLISDGFGVMTSLEDDTAPTDILVTESIKAKEIGVLLEKYERPMAGPDADSEDETEDYKLNVTVWKIEPNENGNVAELLDMGRYLPIVDVRLSAGPADDELGANGPSRVAATDFEKNNILYIIKVEQPGAGATLKALDENGNALEKSFGFDVAHEGDKVLLKISVKRGYKLLAVYNGNGDKMPLEVDENGDYYFVVPKGGGVYFSVKLKKLEDKKKKESNNEETNNEESTYEEEQPTEEYTYVVDKSSYNSDMPKTGDNNQLGAWILAATASLGGIAGVEVYSKKKLSKKA